MFRSFQKLILTMFFTAFAAQASAMFVQPDWLSVTEPGVGTNRYAYSNNDPINKLDPSGNALVDAGPGDILGGIALGIVALLDGLIDKQDDGLVNGSQGMGLANAVKGMGEAGIGLFGDNSMHSEDTDEDTDEEATPKPGLAVDEEGNLVEIGEDGSISVVGPPEEESTHTEVPGEIPGLVEANNRHSKDPLGQGNRAKGWRGVIEAIGDIFGSDIGPN